MFQHAYLQEKLDERANDAGGFCTSAKLTLRACTEKRMGLNYLIFRGITEGELLQEGAKKSPFKAGTGDKKRAGKEIYDKRNKISKEVENNDDSF